MRHSILKLLSIAAAAVILAFAAYKIPHPAHRYTVAFIGDSYTAGFGVAPGHDAIGYLKSHSDLEVLAYGVPGTSARTWMGYYKQAQRRFIVSRPDVFMISFGPNDARKGDSAEVYLQNIGFLANKLHADYPVAKIIVNAPGYILGNSADIEFHYDDEAKARILTYVQALKSEPRLTRAGFVSLGDTALYDLFLGAEREGRSLLCADTVHPNEAGYVVIAQHWLTVLDAHYHEGM